VERHRAAAAAARKKRSSVQTNCARATGQTERTQHS
jgi:hypothetical protein